jgi:anti-sigma factor RsiW
MMAPELHADDLLDKEARGKLSPAERVRLDRHVEACSVCRFERQVRDDFRLEFETLGKADRREAKESRRAAGARANGRMSFRMRLFLLAAAATLVIGAAVAGWETIKRIVLSSYVMNDSREIHPGEGRARTEAPKDTRVLGLKADREARAQEFYATTLT